MIQEKYCLFIGNTRWHWSIQKQERWEFVHSKPESEKLKQLKSQIWKWAAVGELPKDVILKDENCIETKDIPIINLPNWIGVDRGLATWAAFRKAKSKNIHSKGLLIADAGTILSLTRITGNGEFAGGQLVPGLHLQRSSMSTRAEKLDPISKQYIPKKLFPFKTEEAMLRGSFQALIGTLIEAQREEQLPIWLCGGDSEELFRHLKHRKIDVHHHPNLVLEAMIDINLRNH